MKQLGAPPPSIVPEDFGQSASLRFSCAQLFALAGSEDFERLKTEKEVLGPVSRLPITSTHSNWIELVAIHYNISNIPICETLHKKTKTPPKIQ